MRPRGIEGGPKRTPQHIGDPFAHSDAYEVESVLAQCFKRGAAHFKVWAFPIMFSDFLSFYGEIELKTFVFLISIPKPNVCLSIVFPVLLSFAVNALLDSGMASGMTVE